MGKRRRQHQSSHSTPSRKIPVRTWNMLTGVVLFAVLVIGIFMVVIFFNPQTALNPLRVATPPEMISLPSATATNWELPATWTPSMEPLAVTSTPTPEGGNSENSAQFSDGRNSYTGYFLHVPIPIAGAAGAICQYALP